MQSIAVFRAARWGNPVGDFCASAARWGTIAALAFFLLAAGEQTAQASILAPRIPLRLELFARHKVESIQHLYTQAAAETCILFEKGISHLVQRVNSLAKNVLATLAWGAVYNSRAPGISSGHCWPDALQGQACRGDLPSAPGVPHIFSGVLGFSIPTLEGLLRPPAAVL